jgi:hypothetical protein
MSEQLAQRLSFDQLERLAFDGVENLTPKFRVILEEDQELDVIGCPVVMPDDSRMLCERFKVGFHEVGQRFSGLLMVRSYDKVII